MILPFVLTQLECKESIYMFLHYTFNFDLFIRIILGGGVIKHHTCNANLMRNGADFSVYINTGQVAFLSNLEFVMTVH